VCFVGDEIRLHVEGLARIFHSLFRSAGLKPAFCGQDVQSRL
jgi:hypothetical protein